MLVVASGNTSQAKREQPATTVYPRWRGEHSPRRSGVFSTTGLSPLARGTLGAGSYTELRNRSIPARAGNTYFGEGRAITLTVYPRSRGEHGTGV